MLFPYKIIESRILSRNEFLYVDGYELTHAFFYLKKGNFSIEINDKNESIHEGECLILPDYIHFRRNVIDPIEFVYIEFVSDQSCPFSFDLPCGKIKIQDKQRFMSSIETLERLIVCEDTLSAGYREHLLADILFQIYFENLKDNKHNDSHISHDKLVNTATDYIEKNLAKKLTIDDICHTLGTNASTLNFKFRREFNMSIGQFITSERMKRARRLLAGTSYNISAIASRCGYENTYYFSNAFKKMHGIPPSQYMKFNSGRK